MSSVENGQLIQQLVAADTAKKPEWPRLGVTSGVINVYALIMLIEYNIKFNGSKSRMLLFKGRQCKDSQRMLIIDGVTIHCSESVSDLGHNVFTNDKDSIPKSANASFWRSFNLFRSDLGHIYSFIKCKLFQQYCCSFYGAPLRSLISVHVWPEIFVTDIVF